MSILRGDDLAYATLDYIRTHPEEWDQETYICDKTAICGSTACFAGRAVMLGLDLGYEAALCALIIGEHGPDMVAAGLLGWTATQADYVFGCLTREFTELEQAVKAVLNGETR